MEKIFNPKYTKSNHKEATFIGGHLAYYLNEWSNLYCVAHQITKASLINFAFERLSLTKSAQEEALKKIIVEKIRHAWETHKINSGIPYNSPQLGKVFSSFKEDVEKELLNHKISPRIIRAILQKIERV